MKTFEQIQTEKTQHAEKLLELLPKIAGLPKNEKQLTTLAGNFRFLMEKIKEQKQMCNDQQGAMLDEELSAIQDKQKGLNADLIEHIEQASKGAELQMASVRAALILIASRKTSINMLK
ncbi:Uncharacterised protein [uncultured archaeon]|nr:Uncharacterised protein [uncultured archaeon]